jgi:hypothetical protein
MMDDDSSLSLLDRTAAVLEACRDDPALFQSAVLGRELWHKQTEICQAVAEYPITLIPAGRAVGKSYILAGIVLWWLYTRHNSLVITTGPDFRQVVSVLWKEIRRALRPRYLDGERIAPLIPLEWDHLTAGYASPQRLSLMPGSDWGALGFAASTAEGFGGQHSGDLLVIVDEAAGIETEIWGAIHGLAATKLVAAGNPIRYDCHFRELHDLACAGSTTIASVPISALESPDVDHEQSPVGMASASFLRQMREIHGEHSPWWQSNILGRFPGEETVLFIPKAWIDRCSDPAVPDDELWRDHPDGEAQCAVDVGGGVGADRSVVLIRNDKRLLAVFASEWHGVLDDARHRLEPVVVDMCRKWGIPGSRVTYDKGNMGRNFGAYLAKYGLPGAFGYFGAGRGGRLYVNRRTACAFALRRRLDPHRDGYVPFYCGGIPAWSELRKELNELRSPTMLMDEGVIKQALEEKSELAGRLHRSPDLLDALLMSFATFN